MVMIKTGTANRLGIRPPVKPATVFDGPGEAPLPKCPGRRTRQPPVQPNSASPVVISVAASGGGEFSLGWDGAVRQMIAENNLVRARPRVERFPIVDRWPRVERPASVQRQPRVERPMSISLGDGLRGRACSSCEFRNVAYVEDFSPTVHVCTDGDVAVTRCVTRRGGNIARFLTARLRRVPADLGEGSSRSLQVRQHCGPRQAPTYALCRFGRESGDDHRSMTLDPCQHLGRGNDDCRRVAVQLVGGRCRSPHRHRPPTS